MTNLSIRVPQARRDGLVMTVVQDDLLVYDQTVHEVLHLNSVAAVIWDMCDGTRTIADIAFATGHDPDVVIATLEMLATSSLLENPLPDAFRNP